MVSVDDNAVKAMTAYNGYQYVRKVHCGDAWEYKVEKQVYCQSHFGRFSDTLFPDNYKHVGTKRNDSNLH